MTLHRSTEDTMEQTLKRNLAQYRTITGRYRRIKRKAIITYIGWMREVRAGKDIRYEPQKP